MYILNERRLSSYPSSIQQLSKARRTMSSAQQQRITEAEQRKYWDIFTALNPINGYLNGFQAKSVLENSQLDNLQLEQIWDLADVDNGSVCCLLLCLRVDGNLDFEEFCVAMRLIFDVINGVRHTAFCGEDRG
jgi:hypothetical protein